MSYDPNELPEGWAIEFDSIHDHPFWVDTKAKPPRSIWTHPYEDELFLREHPEIRKRLAKSSDHLSPNDAPPPYSPRRHSFSGHSAAGPSSPRPDSIRNSASQPGTPARAPGADGQKSRGFFGKLKDKTIGTKEEREEARRLEALQMQQIEEQRRKYYEEMRRQQRQQRQSMPTRQSGYYQQQSQYGYGQPGYGQSMYAAPYGSPFGGGYGGYGGRQRNGNSGFGGGGVALPLIGGLAGGLLLGDVLDGGFGGGGFGGGGFF